MKKLLGIGPQTDWKALVESGAQLIDVRTAAEFEGGHIQGSVNIPLQSLSGSLSKISKDKPVITCCASGMRSASAKTFLKAKGFKDIYNGGSWVSLQHKIL